jgi:hypothetical protein
MMKKLATALCLAIAFAMPTIVLAQQTQTKNGTWTYNGYDYELWSENNAGTTSMTLNGDNGSGANAKGGTFSATWSNTINILFRAGRKFSTTTGGTISGREPPKPALDYGNISIDFAATWSSSDNVKMLGVYGWAFYAQGSIPTKDENGNNKTFSKEIEYYIIQDRGSYNAATGGDTKSTVKGEATIDGILYEFRVCDRINRNALSGSSVNFKQYFSVPKNTSSHRTSGIISVSKHFSEWAKVGMVMDGPLYEVAMKVESYTGQGGNANGSATVTKNLLTVGGTTPSSNSGGTSSSSKANSSSSAARTQATTCKTPLITYPTNTVPADPYTACFKYTNNKCYVCRVANESDANTCASGWVWNGSQIDNNIKDGYWYYEVACPATSSSSAAVSSSSRASSSSAAVSSSSRASSSSAAASSSSRASSSSAAVSSSSSTAASSSSSGAVSSSSTETESSSSNDDETPILKNRISVSYFSVQTLSDKALRIEISSPSVVEIFDLKGNKAASFDVSSTLQTVKLSLPNGVYFAKVRGMKSIRFVLR